MARISPLERQRLGRLRPELWELVLALFDAWNAESDKVIYIAEDGGTRTRERQEQLYAWALEAGGGHQTAYAVGAPGNSRHEYGAAIDAHIIGGTDGDYRRLAELGESLGLVAGYYFATRGVGKKDVYHFQLNESLEESKRKWSALRTAGLVQAVGVVLLAIGAAKALQ